MASPAKKAKTDDLPVCPYGARCYRKNPQHFKDFSHDSGTPDKAKASTSKADPLSSVDMSKLPPCKYGATCYRKNLLHFAEYSHPTTVLSSIKSNDSDSGNDTEEVSSDDDEDNKKKTGKAKDLLNRGMSLIKSYSKMSEEERLELIKKAFEAKKKLEEELKETQNKMKEKDKELQNLQNQVNTGLLLLEGEKEALEGKETKYFTLQAERAYKEGSAAQTHFRLAESQFYRLLTNHSGYQVEKVEYVVNPTLVKIFKEAREDLKKHRGEDMSYPVLGFHGTNEANIKPICQTGFKVPGEKGFAHKTDTGWYGKGVYFSEFPDYSMGYINGATKLLLCQVLPGKVFNCTKLIHGAPLQKNYDSHTSPDKKELVIFNSHHILPSYIVHYGSGKGDFKYKTTSKVGGASKVTTAKADDSSPEDLLDPTEVSNAYFNASNKKATKAFKGQSIQFTGTFSTTQKGMVALAAKHGSAPATPSVFTILVASQNEFEIMTNKVCKAMNKGVPIVKERFLYDCIIKGKLLDTTDYSWE